MVADLDKAAVAALTRQFVTVRVCLRSDLTG